MELQEAAILARVTWFAGVIIFFIGIIIKHDALIQTAGLAIAGGVIGTALVARR